MRVGAEMEPRGQEPAFILQARLQYLALMLRRCWYAEKVDYSHLSGGLYVTCGCTGKHAFCMDKGLDAGEQ